MYTFNDIALKNFFKNVQLYIKQENRTGKLLNEYSASGEQEYMCNGKISSVINDNIIGLQTVCYLQ